MSGMTNRTATLEPRAGGRYSLNPHVQLAYLWEEWRLMFRPSMIVGDALSGTAVALVVLPLSLAIANASGVKPEVGLVTAIVGGLIVVLFGGCRLQVSGPALANSDQATSRSLTDGIDTTTLAGRLFFYVMASLTQLGLAVADGQFPTLRPEYRLKVREIEPTSPSTSTMRRPRDSPKHGLLNELRLTVVFCPSATGWPDRTGDSETSVIEKANAGLRQTL